MKKFLLAMTFCLSILCSTANAQDIYASSKDGCDYYVISESVAWRELKHTSESGKVFRGGETTGNVKKIRGGKLIAVQSWRFGAFYGHAVAYKIDGVRIGSFNSPNAHYAQEIMFVMDRCVGRP